MQDERITALLQHLLEQTHQIKPDQLWKEVSLVLVNDEQIRQVNKQYLHKDRATDVISFTYKSLPGETPSANVGEVIINVQRAYEEGAKRSTPSEELALYIAHGCLHLVGFEDDTSEKRSHMGKQEEKLLQQAAHQNYSTQLFKGSRTV